MPHADQNLGSLEGLIQSASVGLIYARLGIAGFNGRASIGGLNQDIAMTALQISLEIGRFFNASLQIQI